MNTDYEVQIATLKETMENMRKSIETEREEYKTIYQNNKKMNSNINLLNPYTYNSSNMNYVQTDDYKTFVDEEYYKENVFINNLKTQITNLIKHNDSLKIKNRELTEENELLKGEFRI